MEIVTQKHFDIQDEELHQEIEETTQLINELEFDRNPHWNPSTQPLNDSLPEEEDTVFCIYSEKNLSQFFFRNNPEMRHRKIVIKWLEAHYQSEIKKSPFLSDKIIFDKADQPRGPFSILDQSSIDVEVQERFFSHLFELLRAGQLESAQSECARFMPWRAATLQGGGLFHNPPARSAQEGNPHRKLWKKACFKLSDSSKFSKEAAVYGVLGGNVNAVRPMCRDWKDYLWIHFKANLEDDMDKWISEFHQKYSDPKAPVKIVENPKNVPPVDEVWNVIENKFPFIASDPFYIIQKNLILGEIDYIFEKMSEWCYSALQGRQRWPYDFLKFCAETAVLYKTKNNGLPEEHEAGFKSYVTILTSFIKYSIKLQKLEHIAYFTSELPKDYQARTFGEFLFGIDDRDEQHNSFRLAKTQHRLSMPDIAVMVHQLCTENPFKEIEKEIEKKITALELVWSAGSDLALEKTNVTCSEFLQKTITSDLYVDAVQRAIKLVPKDYPNKNTIAFEEFKCYKSYVSAHALFQTWQTNQRMKPHPPHSPTGTDIHNEISYTMELEKFKREYEKWEEVQRKCGVAVINKIKKILFWPGGWLSENIYDKNQMKRNWSLKQTRRTFIPELIFWYHTIFFENEDYLESMQVAKFLADPENRLDNDFDAPSAQKLMTLLAKSSLKLQKRADPFGIQK